MKKRSLAILALMAAPFAAAAQQSPFNGVGTYVGAAMGIVNMLITLTVAAALLVFIWGLVRFIAVGTDSDKGREEGRQLMVWGVIALFVMASIGGLVWFLQYNLDIYPNEIEVIQF